MNRILRSI